MTHSIPDSCAVALTTELGTVLLTGDYKFDQTPVDGPAGRRLAAGRAGRDGVLLLCGDSTNADRPGFSPSERGVGPHLQEAFTHAPGQGDRDAASPPTSTASSRWSTPPPRSGARSRWSAARCARTSTSAARSGTSRCPTGC